MLGMLIVIPMDSAEVWLLSRDHKNIRRSVVWVDLDLVLLDFSLTVKAAPHACEIRTSQP